MPELFDPMRPQFLILGDSSKDAPDWNQIEFEPEGSLEDAIKTVEGYLKQNPDSIYYIIKATPVMRMATEVTTTVLQTPLNQEKEEVKAKSVPPNILNEIEGAMVGSDPTKGGVILGTKQWERLIALPEVSDFVTFSTATIVKELACDAFISASGIRLYRAIKNDVLEAYTNWPGLTHGFKAYGGRYQKRHPSWFPESIRKELEAAKADLHKRTKPTTTTTRRCKGVPKPPAITQRDPILKRIDTLIWGADLRKASLLLGGCEWLELIEADDVMKSVVFETSTAVGDEPDAVMANGLALYRVNDHQGLKLCVGPMQLEGEINAHDGRPAVRNGDWWPATVRAAETARRSRIRVPAPQQAG